MRSDRAGTSTVRSGGSTWAVARVLAAMTMHEMMRFFMMALLAQWGMGQAAPPLLWWIRAISSPWRAVPVLS
ncbi:hypothetical protein D3C72_2500640 [compost metagenome]